MKKVLRQCIILSCFLFLVTGCGKKEVTLEQYFERDLSLKELGESVDKTDGNIMFNIKFLEQEGQVDFEYEDGEITEVVNYAALFDENSKYKNGNEFKEAFANYLEKLFGEKGNNSLKVEESSVGEPTSFYKASFIYRDQKEMELTCIIHEKSLLIYFGFM